LKAELMGLIHAFGVIYERKRRVKKDTYTQRHMPKINWIKGIFLWIARI